MDKLHTLNYLLNTDYKTLGEAQQDLLKEEHLDNMNNPSLYYIFFMENVVSRHNNIINTNGVLRFVNAIEDSLEHRYMLVSSTLKTLGYTTHKLVDILSGYSIKFYERELTTKVKNSPRFKGAETVKSRDRITTKSYDDKIELLDKYLTENVFTEKALSLLDNYSETTVAVTSNGYVYDLEVTKIKLKQFIINLSRLKMDSNDLFIHKNKPFETNQKEQMLRLIGNIYIMGYKNYTNASEDEILTTVDDLFRTYYNYIKAIKTNDKLAEETIKGMLVGNKAMLQGYLTKTLQDNNPNLFFEVCLIYSNLKKLWENN